MNKYKRLRKEHNLTQEELANRIYVKQSAVSKWECDRAVPDYPTLQKLAEIYNTTTDYLIGKTDNPEPPKKHTYSEIETLFLKAGLTDEQIKAMTPERKQQAIDYLIFLSTKDSKQ